MTQTLLNLNDPVHLLLVFLLVLLIGYAMGRTSAGQSIGPKQQPKPIKEDTTEEEEPWMIEDQVLDPDEDESKALPTIGVG